MVIDTSAAYAKISIFAPNVKQQYCKESTILLERVYSFQTYNYGDVKNKIKSKFDKILSQKLFLLIPFIFCDFSCFKKFLILAWWFSD